jgi:hypothetical protein
MAETREWMMDGGESSCGGGDRLVDGGDLA